MAPQRDTPMRVLITGAAGQIGYALAPMVARGAMLGSEQGVILHLLDIPFAADSLEGVRMELVDAAFPLVKGVCSGERATCTAPPWAPVVPRHMAPTPPEHLPAAGCLPRSCVDAPPLWPRLGKERVCRELTWGRQT